jgi:hypothetical protein
MATPQLTRRKFPWRVSRNPWAGLDVSPIPPAQASSVDQGDERAALYLRTLGLVDEKRLAEVTRAILGASESDGREPAGGARSESPLEVAMRLGDAWAERCCAGPPASASHALAAWRLRRLLGSHPQAFLESGDIPDQLRKAVERPEAWVVPGSRPARMTSESLGDLPPALRSDVWLSLGRRASSVWQTLLMTLAGW